MHIALDSWNGTCWCYKHIQLYLLVAVCIASQGVPGLTGASWKYWRLLSAMKEHWYWRISVLLLLLLWKPRMAALAALLRSLAVGARNTWSWSGPQPPWWWPEPTRKDGTQCQQQQPVKLKRLIRKRGSLLERMGHNVNARKWYS